MQQEQQQLIAAQGELRLCDGLYFQGHFHGSYLQTIFVKATRDLLEIMNILHRKGFHQYIPARDRKRPIGPINFMRTVRVMLSCAKFS